MQYSTAKPSFAPLFRCRYHLESGFFIAIMAQYEILPVPHRRNNCGIYRLHNNGVVVYVGSSLNIEQRVMTHFCERTKDFDGYSFFLSPHETLLDIETEEILKHSPIYNDRLPSYSKYTTFGAFLRKCKNAGLTDSGGRFSRALRKGLRTIQLVGNIGGFDFYKVSDLEGLI